MTYDLILITPHIKLGQTKSDSIKVLVISFDTCQVPNDDSSQFAVSFFFALVSIWSWWAWHLFFHFLFCRTVSSSATMAMARLPCGSCWQCQKAPQQGWRTNRTDPQKGGRRWGRIDSKMTLVKGDEIMSFFKYEDVWSMNPTTSSLHSVIVPSWFFGLEGCFCTRLFCRYICLLSSLQVLVQWIVWGPRLGHLWAESWPARLLFNDDLL